MGSGVGIEVAPPRPTPPAKTSAKAATSAKGRKWFVDVFLRKDRKDIEWVLHVCCTAAVRLRRRNSPSS